ncbi:hypothetical protein CBR_g58075 [Chara braunii]|uniref:Protein kinase domain-containing protein n=1 Tax=Chara braunii TaxID=69332 RepID=A0A388MEK7_CHABU|nr:hypothetical protein CBR_g58075 [Chara braunii]|eukprot:GBG92990.1 hypothetical protein CBR_g58075 [Chara braunii]
MPSAVDSSPTMPSSSGSPPSTPDFSDSIPFTPSSVDSSQGSSAGARLVLLNALPIVSATSVALVAGVLFVVCRRQRDDKTSPSLSSAKVHVFKVSQSSSSYNGMPLILSANTVTDFRLCDLQRCTNNFDSRYRIGYRGACYTVYRGQIDSTDLAIKVMEETHPLRETIRRQFLAEVTTLSRVHHPNLLKAVGYCGEGDKCILIAHALEYLHYGTYPPLIHGSLSSYCVLLSVGAEEELRAVVTDFGIGTLYRELVHSREFGTCDDTAPEYSSTGGYLAQKYSTTCDDHATEYSSTGGYLAPEYLTRGMYTPKNDVYGFGVMLLELLTGKPVIRPASGDHREVLRCWVEQSYTDTSSDLMQSFVDPYLRDEVGSSTALMNTVAKAASLAMECTTVETRERPTMMFTVVRRLREVSQVMPEVKKGRFETSGNGT